MSLGQGEPLRRYIENGIGVSLPEEATFIGKVVDGEVVNVAAAYNYCGYDMEIALWSTGRFHRDFLRRIGKYMFTECGCRRVTSRVREGSPMAAIMNKAGYVREGVLRAGDVTGANLLVYGILKEEYRHG